MATDDDNIGYSGPSKEWSPSIGGNKEGDPNKALTAEASGGYDNIDWLRQMLDALILANTDIINKLEVNLNLLALKITPTEADNKLRQALASEWPDPSSNPPDFIPYAYYRSLTARSSAGAAYIQKRWEEAVRDITGTSSFDIVDIARMVRSEAILVKGFLDSYVGEVSDSSEKRVVELFQDWAASALQRTQRYEQIAEGNEFSRQLPVSEVESTSPADAVKFQALFKARLNQLNTELETTKSGLKKNFADYSEVFYTKFLGPALSFRLNVSRGIYPGDNSVIGREVDAARGSMDSNLSSLLTDQLRRNAIFNKGIDEVLDTVLERDTYRTYVSQLATVGKILESNDRLNKMQSMSLEVVESYPLLDMELATPVFTAPHNLLSDRENPEAHPQYLLKSGGEMTGDTTLADGVKIDGMIPREHRHRGVDVDGTPKIKGADIEDLVTSAIKRDEDMCYPKNLRHISNKPFTGTNNVTLVNSQIAWDCDPRMTFEVQTVPVGARPGPSVSPVDYCVTTLYETNLDIVAGLGSDFNFFTFATATAVYTYNWTPGILTRIAGQEGTDDDKVGDSLASARFSVITDLTQDFYDGRIYVADSVNRKVKMTGKATTAGISLPMDVTTVYTSPYQVKRIDTQGQNFLNTMYVLVGPDNFGRDRVIKLVDTDGNNLQSGTYGATEIEKLSSKYTNVKDIAVTPNGFVYLLVGTSLIQYDPNTNSVKTHNIADDSGAVPTAITSDHEGSIYITYSGYAKKFKGNAFSLFVGSSTMQGDEDGPALSQARFMDLQDITSTWDSVQRKPFSAGNRFYSIDNNKIKLIHNCADDIVVAPPYEPPPEEPEVYGLFVSFAGSTSNGTFSGAIATGQWAYVEGNWPGVSAPTTTNGIARLQPGTYYFALDPVGWFMNNISNGGEIYLANEANQLLSFAPVWSESGAGALTGTIVITSATDLVLRYANSCGNVNSITIGSGTLITIS